MLSRLYLTNVRPSCDGLGEGRPRPRVAGSTRSAGSVDRTAG